MAIDIWHLTQSLVFYIIQDELPLALQKIVLYSDVCMY